jgi:hypothetical protein
MAGFRQIARQFKKLEPHSDSNNVNAAPASLNQTKTRGTFVPRVFFLTV